MLSPPLSVHAKTEISTILFLPGKYCMFAFKASLEFHLSGFSADMTNRLRDSRHALRFFFGYVLFFFSHGLTKWELFYYLKLNFHTKNSDLRLFKKSVQSAQFYINIYIF